MQFQPNPDLIRWRLHLQASPATVYQTLATDQGRASFWAESAVEEEGVIHFYFPNGATWNGAILAAQPPSLFCIRYYGNSVTTFTMADDGHGGTDLMLTDVGVPPEDRMEVIAGWVSVLMNLKAAIDFGIDLRTHDIARSWDQGYVEN